MELLLTVLLAFGTPENSPTEGYGDLFKKDASPTEGYGDLFKKDASPTEGYGDLF